MQSMKRIYTCNYVAVLPVQAVSEPLVALDLLHFLITESCDCAILCSVLVHLEDLVDGFTVQEPSCSFAKLYGSILYCV